MSLVCDGSCGTATDVSSLRPHGSVDFRAIFRDVAAHTGRSTTAAAGPTGWTTAGLTGSAGCKYRMSYSVRQN